MAKLCLYSKWVIVRRHGGVGNAIKEASVTRQHTHRILSGLAIGATLFAAACNPGTPANEPEPGAQGSAGSSQQVSADPSSFAGEELSYLYFTDGPDEQATRDNIKKFEEEFDVKVNLELMPYADLVTQLNARLSSGDAPDVARLSGLGDFRDDLLPLDNYVADDFESQFLEGPMSGAKNGDGEIIAVPSDLTLNGVFINVDQFEAAGVALPDSSDPWTWDEMIESAKKVQESQNTSYAFAIDKSGHRLSTVLAQHGTFLMNEEGYALDDAQATEALQPLVDMMKDDTMPRDFWLGTGARYQGANEIFLAGDTPIYMSGTWQVGQFAAEAPFTWAAAPNPCAAECGGFPGGKFMAALKDSSNPALAAFFVEWMNNKDNQEHFASVSGNLPTRQDLAEDGVEYDAKAQAAMDIFIEDLERTGDGGYISNSHPAFSGVGTSLLKQLDEVIAGNTDLGTALETVRTEAEALVEETK